MPLDVIGALLAPSECRVCALPLQRVGPHPVCQDCLQAIGGNVQGVSAAACYRCGDALGMEPGWGLARAEDLRCDSCRQQEPAFLRAVSSGRYGGVLRTLIHLHKFEHMQSLAQPLGKHLARAIGSFAGEVPSGLLVIAVPLFRRRRPFNQSAAIADVSVKLLQKDRPHWPLRTEHRLLRRTRATESQSLLTPAQRRSNVRGAFTVTGDVRGRDVLLVDDVYTTGATAEECTRVLLRAGAASVRVATLARAMRDLVAAWEPASAFGGPATLAKAQHAEMPAGDTSSKNLDDTRFEESAG